ncbi:MAG TPA: hypothetical protein VNT99_01675, partial [Methylomirabilota bacterium]|nr:hypothetical protein [Methylomirabilota bacterium]
LIDLVLDAQGNVILAGSGADDYLTLKIQTALPEIPTYRFTSIAFTNGNVQLTWTPAPGLMLQRTTSLIPPDWQTVSGSTNTNRIVVPATGASGFFQLAKP